MRVIYKFGLTNCLTQLTLCEPRFLHVGMQHGAPQLWVAITEGDLEKPHERWRIEARGTGHTYVNEGWYLGTLVTENDTLVLHFFAVKV